MHNKVKANVVDDFKYEEMLSFTNVGRIKLLRDQNAKKPKVDCLKQVREKEKKALER